MYFSEEASWKPINKKGKHIRFGSSENGLCFEIQLDPGIVMAQKTVDNDDDDDGDDDNDDDDDDDALKIHNHMVLPASQMF